MSFQALKKKKSRGRIILLSQCSQTPESHYDNLVLLNLHLQFHLKNPLCFLPCKVEVRTESGQGPSTRKREAEKVNIPPPRKEALLPCWVSGKQRQQNSSSFQKTGLRDSCRSVPGIVLVWLVCFRLCSRRRGAARALAADSVPGHLDQLQHLFQANVLPGWVPKISHSGRVYTLEINKCYESCCFPSIQRAGC